MSNLTKFNLTLSNFIDDLIRVFPNYNNLEIFKEKFLLLKSTNPRLIVTYFTNTIYPYKSQIESKDASFFLEKDYSDDITIENKQWALDEMLNLKTLWNKLDDNNKETVWKYFLVLLKLCEIINSQ